MINFLNSLFGCFFALLIHDILFKKEAKSKADAKEKRIASTNNSFEDIMSGYTKYQDKHTQLYRSIARKEKNRVE